MKWKFFTSYMCIFIGQVYRKKAEKYILLVLIYIVDSFKSEEKEFHWNNFGNIILMERRKKTAGFWSKIISPLGKRGIFSALFILLSCFLFKNKSKVLCKSYSKCQGKLLNLKHNTRWSLCSLKINLRELTINEQVI